jgi:Na+-driven multidrug efflux pump
MVNEMLWACGMAVISQSYSLRGLSVVAAVNITSTIFNVISVVYIALGDSVAIMVGRQLGANAFQEAKDTAYKMIAFAVFSCVLTGLLMGILGPIFPKLYDTTDEIRYLACGMIWSNAICMPAFGFLHACYFTLRSGGKTGITFLFDCGYLWIIMVPLAIGLSRFTTISILPLYFATKFIEVGKCALGAVLVSRGAWINNMVSK